MRKRTKLDLKGIQQFRERLDAATKVGLLMTGIAVRDEAQLLAPKDTEALTDSIHIAASEGTDWQAAIETAQAKVDDAILVGRTPKGRKVGTYLFYPEIKPTEPNQVWVVCGARHGLLQELGTIHNPPAPFIAPAVTANKFMLGQVIKSVFRGMKTKTTITKNKG